MSELYLGLISGTSVDSIDAALVDLTTTTPGLITSLSFTWPEKLREAIFATRSLADTELNQLTELDRQIAETFAEAANSCLQQAGIAASQVTAIGSHGQTIRHRPDIEQPFSLQLGDAAVIAELTGIDVVSDFRSADIEAGGQGAPMVPAFHQAVFRQPGVERTIVNIGGVANITVLPGDTTRPVIGFDTGPGNNMMDAWTARQLQQDYDKDGSFAASGKTDASLLAKCLMDEYFSQTPPKSTGFELFNLDWLERHIENKMRPEDVQSTLCDLTTTSIIRDINRHAPDTTEIFVCGGGAHNTELMRRMQAMTLANIASTDSLGIHPDWVEAMTFAWLAKQRLVMLPGNIPSVTGADREMVLGTLSNA